MLWMLLVMWIILSGLGCLRVGEAECPGPGFDDSEPEEWAEEPAAAAVHMLDGEWGLWDERHGVELDALASLECTPSVPFVLAEGFGGAKPGYVFKCGTQGLGYYLDERSDLATVVADGPGGPWPAYLDQLLLCSMGLPDTQAGDVVGSIHLCLMELLFEGFRMPNSTVDQTGDFRSSGERARGRPSKGRRPPRHRVRKRARRKGEHVVIPKFVDVKDTLHWDDGLWAIDSVNPNCAAGAQKHLAQSTADFVMVQELRAPSVSACMAQERAARRAKWGLVTAPAVVTDQGGVSAGVAIAGRSHFGMCKHDTPLHSASEHTPGWAVASHVGAMGKGGVHLISVYCWCSEGLSQRNLDLLQDVARLISRLNGPWCLAADFNFEPQALADCGWLDLVQGRIVAPDAPTCGKKVYDYFVVSKSLRHVVVGVAVVEGACFYPHSPARLFINGKPWGTLSRCCVAPRKLPAEIPHGCLLELVNALGPNVSFSELASVAFQQADDEIVQLCAWEGRDADKCKGRARGHRFVMKNACGPHGSALPNCSAVTAAWQCMCSWIRTLVLLWDHWDDNGGCCLKVRAAWRRLGSQDWSVLGQGRNAMALQDWVGMVNWRGISSKMLAIPIMRAVAGVCGKAHEHDAHASKIRWLSWLQEGPARGLGRQHRMYRCGTGWIASKLAPLVICEGGGFDDLEGITDDMCDGEVVGRGNVLGVPLGQQQSVDAEADTWTDIWQHGVVGSMPL
jgi:hypothetical protein